MANYLIIENQQEPSGEILYGSETENAARALFYTKCAAAVDSTVKTHSIVLMTGVGQVLDRAVFKH